MYASAVPKLWTETIEAHRREVGEAIIHTTASLVADHGLRSVTMSQIADETGIGRATLYKYFPDVESILLAWHERQIAAHLAHLVEVRDQVVGPGPRLAAVLGAYASITHESRGHSDSELTAMLHGDRRVLQAERQLHGMIGDLIREGARTGEFRGDVDSDELATYCLHALAGATGMRSRSAVRRLVEVTLSGLTPRV